MARAEAMPWFETGKSRFVKDAERRAFLAQLLGTCGCQKEPTPGGAARQQHSGNVSSHPGGGTLQRGTSAIGAQMP